MTEIECQTFFYFFRKLYNFLLNNVLCSSLERHRLVLILLLQFAVGYPNMSQIK